MTSSISKFGRTESFEFQVGKGDIGYHTAVHVFGFNADADSATEETVWPPGTAIPYLSAPVTMEVSSSSTADASAGTGARTVYIKGINNNGSEAEETVTLNGQTAVNTTKTYSFIQQVTVLTVGSGGVNAGNIYVGTGTVTTGVPAVTHGFAGIGENNSLTGAWQCPAGHKAYVTYGSIGSGTENGANFITGRLKLMDANGVQRTAAIVTFANGLYPFDFTFPVTINPGERITATVKTSADNEAVSCYFQIVLVEDAP